MYEIYVYMYVEYVWIKLDFWCQGMINVFEVKKIQIWKLNFGMWLEASWLSDGWDFLFHQRFPLCTLGIDGLAPKPRNIDKQNLRSTFDTQTCYFLSYLGGIFFLSKNPSMYNVSEMGSLPSQGTYMGKTYVQALFIQICPFLSYMRGFSLPSKIPSMLQTSLCT